MAPKKSIAQTLVEAGRLSFEDLQRTEEEAQQKKISLDDLLIAKKVISEEERASLLADQMGVLYVDLENYLVDPECAKLVPESFAKKHTCIPLFSIGKTLTVAMTDPQNIPLIDELRMKTGYEIEPCLSTETMILHAIDQYYGVSGSIQDILKEIEQQRLTLEAQRKGRSLEEIAGEAPIVKLVNLIIMQALRDRASDIHLEPEEDKFRVRYRIDGILHEVVSAPKELQAVVTSRVKILSKLDIAEKRIPQDGRLQLKTESREIDLRVSTFPTVHGENVVMRLLDRSSLILGLEDLGFSRERLTLFKKMIHRPYGIVLVTGPTGSGKTTTLYSTLNTINTTEKNIITVEDPVEYHLELIRQCQINPKIGLTFAAGLRSILRQDPDIVMVGEIRDLETAEIAIHAALTGQLVFSTLHTNDAPSAITRLVDMGIEPFLIASSVLGVLAQRLVRVICPKCKISYTPNPEEAKELGMEWKETLLFYKGKGCSYCKNTGYKGRLGIFQLMEMNESLRELILKDTSADQIRRQAQLTGMGTLREDGWGKILAGRTTTEEVLRVTQEV